MLQCAWVCKSRRSELLAYDLIGMQWYYLGEADKARFYHDKMMYGEAETGDSDLRKLGTGKMVAKLMDKDKRKLMINVQSMEEEANNGNRPLSEDDFELPSPSHEIAKKAELTDYKNLDDKEKMKSKAAKILIEKKLKSRLKVVDDDSVSRIRRHPPQTALHQSANFSNMSSTSYSLHPSKVKDAVYVNHLSPNRAIMFNFVRFDTSAKLIMGRPVNPEESAGQAFDVRAIELVKAKLDKLKDNVLVVYNKINHITTQEMFKMKQEILKNSKYVVHKLKG